VSALGKASLTAVVTLVVAAAVACSSDDAGTKSAFPATASESASASASASPSPGPATPTATVTVTATGVPTPTIASVTPTIATITPDVPTLPPTPVAGAGTPPTTYAEALAHVQAARDVSAGGASGPRRFTSPSGNIYCDLDFAACEIQDGKVDDPSACPGGMTTRVGRIELQGNQPVAVCNTDTIVQPGAPVLGYGQSVTTRDTQCVSERIGITCVARGAETGFFLAKGTYLLLG
jgi:hypothetical protein